MWELFPISTSYQVHCLCRYYFCQLFLLHLPVVTLSVPKLIFTHEILWPINIYILLGLFTDLNWSFPSFIFSLFASCALSHCFFSCSWQLPHWLFCGQLFYSFSPCSLLHLLPPLLHFILEQCYLLSLFNHMWWLRY